MLPRPCMQNGEASVYWQFMTKTALVFHLKWIMLAPSLHKSFESYAVLFKRHEDTSAAWCWREKKDYMKAALYQGLLEQQRGNLRRATNAQN